MANYKDIKGTTVQVQSATQPTTYPQAEGELYYNASNGDYEFLGPGTGAWATGGALPTAVRSGSGTGTQTTAFSFMVRAAPAYPTATQNYNGTAWSTDPIN